MKNSIVDTVLLRAAQVLYESPLLLTLRNYVEWTDLNTLKGRRLQGERTHDPA
jgi:hypothetical protein